MALQPVHTLSSDTVNQDHPRLASQAAYCFSTRGVLTLLCEPIHLSLLESSLINHSHTWAWALPVAWKLFGVSAKMLTETSAYSMLLSSFGANSNRSVYSTGGLNKKRSISAEKHDSWPWENDSTALPPGQPGAWYVLAEASLTASWSGCIEPGGLPCQSIVNILSPF